MITCYSLEDSPLETHLLKTYYIYILRTMIAEEGLVELVEGPPDVGLEALGRLIGHLDRVLEHGDGKGGAGHRAQIEPKVVLHGVGLLGYLGGEGLERQHPRGGQVAVLQENPATRGTALPDQALGYRALALTQRDRLVSNVRRVFMNLLNYCRLRVEGVHT